MSNIKCQIFLFLNQNLLILFLLLFIVLVAFFVQKVWSKYINPRKSFGHFLLYVFANLASIVLIVYLFGLFVIKYRNLLFR